MPKLGDGFHPDGDEASDGDELVVKHIGGAAELRIIKHANGAKNIDDVTDPDGGTEPYFKLTKGQSVTFICAHHVWWVKSSHGGSLMGATYTGHENNKRIARP